MPRHEPERTCIVTREVRHPSDLIRFVLGPEGQVVADLRCKLPGRGVWVTATAGHVREAIKRRLFARAFKAEVKTPPALAEDIEQTLRQDLRQSLSLANKAGNVVTGFTKIESAILEKPFVALIHAAEAAEDGRRKLANQLRKRLGEAISSFPVVQELSNDELDLALGRSHVIHAALVAGAGSDGFLNRWHRYRSYCGTEADQADLPEGAGAHTILEPSGSERNE
ncbi:RNA-binding protein [Microvirga flavescens]|uniref:RNA-binding protein n=1 Tax=Microvirga flavescens TaxID=2249811 RepID=UPI000DD98781|nr:RNA-binding protein [Microvirga flavescens]